MLIVVLGDRFESSLLVLYRVESRGYIWWERLAFFSNFHFLYLIVRFRFSNILVEELQWRSRYFDENCVASKYNVYWI